MLLFACFVTLMSFAAALDISGFQLIDISTNKQIRELDDYDVITTRDPVTVVATIPESSGPVKYVTFSSPVFRREFFAPYSIAGDDRRGTFFPATFPEGNFVISAYVGDEVERPSFRRVQFQPNFPRRGPHPSELEPEPLKRGTLVAPMARKSCRRTKGPSSLQFFVSESGYTFDDLDLAVKTKWCAEDESDIRIRIISFSIDANATISTKVLFQEILKNPRNPSYFTTYGRCEDLFVYAEACVSRRAHGGPELLCRTSRFRWIPKKTVPEPRLKWRPPIQILLAPGDAIAVETTTFVPEDPYGLTDGFSNGRLDDLDIDAVLHGITEKVDGTLSTTLPSKKSVVVNVPNGRGGVSLEDNGALLYVRYSEASCPRSEDSWKSRYNTTILVSKDHKSLVKQDKSLPTFETPVYPETVFMQPAMITVEAENPGGGLREGGVPTELHYQWYLRTKELLALSRSYAEPIPGATGATLNIPEAQCSIGGNCGRSGCFDLREYFVDVCNTFGCRRSELIEPRILPPLNIPDGMVWDEASCLIGEDFSLRER